MKTKDKISYGDKVKCCCDLVSRAIRVETKKEDITSSLDDAFEFIKPCSMEQSDKLINTVLEYCVDKNFNVVDSLSITSTILRVFYTNIIIDTENLMSEVIEKYLPKNKKIELDSQ